MNLSLSFQNVQNIVHCAIMRLNAMSAHKAFSWLKMENVNVRYEDYIDFVNDWTRPKFNYMKTKLATLWLRCVDYSNSFSECAKHCSLCYNETQCYECTPGFYLDENGECKRKLFLI